MDIERINKLIKNVLSENIDKPLSYAVDEIYNIIRLVDDRINIKNLDIDYNIYEESYFCKYKLNGMKVNVKI